MVQLPGRHGTSVSDDASGIRLEVLPVLPFKSSQLFYKAHGIITGPVQRLDLNTVQDRASRRRHRGGHCAAHKSALLFVVAGVDRGRLSAHIDVEFGAARAAAPRRLPRSRLPSDERGPGLS